MREKKRTEFDLQLFAEAGTLVNATGGYVNAGGGAGEDFDESHTLAPEMKDFYSTELLENTRPRLIFGQFGRHVPLKAGHGGVIEFRKWNTFAKADKLTEGVVPGGQKMGVKTVTGRIAQYGTYVSISDRLQLRAYDDVIGGATREMSASLAATAEQLTRDALLTGTNVLYCDNVDMATGEKLNTPTSCGEMEAGGSYASVNASVGGSTGITAVTVNGETFGEKVNGVGGSYAFRYSTADSGWKLGGGAVTPADYGLSVTGTPADGDCVTVTAAFGRAMSMLTPAMVNKAVTILKKNSVPTISGEYVAIVHPSVAHDLRSHPDWLAVHQYAAVKQIFNGEIGSLHGVRFVENATAPVLGAAGDTAEEDDEYVNALRGRTYATYFLGSEAFAIVDPEGGGAEMIIHDREEIGGPLNQFSTIGYKFETNGATILYPERVLRVMSCSAFSAVDAVN